MLKQILNIFVGIKINFLTKITISGKFLITILCFFSEI